VTVFRQVLWIALLAAFLAATTVAFYVGQNYRTNELCCQLAPRHNLLAAIKELAGGFTFHGAEGQDRWVVLEVYPFVRDGFFVDLGSADGVRKSNTKALEDLGWNGVCVDPFPSNMEARRCRLFAVPVDSTGGKRVRFRMARDIGGIEDYLGRWKDATRGVDTVELQTRTVTEILDEVRAPAFIHYMSLDIEGAELAALQGLDFSRYRVGALSIEHNYEEPKRSEIRKLLESHGYRRVRTVEQEDFYLGQRAAGGER
jgi:hypothetical protein